MSDRVKYYKMLILEPQIRFDLKTEFVHFKGRKNDGGEDVERKIRIAAK